MYKLVFIALGGSVGAVSRYLVSKGVDIISIGIFPYGTLTVNILGAFIIGGSFSIFNDLIIPVQHKLMITVGFLGSFTTFSTYSLESINLLINGEYKVAALNILLNNFLSLVAVIGGLSLSRLIYQQLT